MDNHVTADKSPTVRKLTSHYLLTSATRYERQSKTVDRGLSYPARWRGSMRRQVSGHGAMEDTARYVAAYNDLIWRASSPTWTLDLNELLYLHQTAVGGGEFRRTTTRVGGYRNFCHWQRLSSTVNEALEQWQSSNEPQVVSATRLQVALVSIHPFVDGNGRISRLVTSMCLARAGHKSTLAIGVEEAVAARPWDYIGVLDDYWSGRINETQCTARMVEILLAHSVAGALARDRESRLVALARYLGIDGRQIPQALFDVERQKVRSRASALLLHAMKLTGEKLWIEIVHEMPVEWRTMARWQVQRLIDEEIEDSMSARLV